MDNAMTRFLNVARWTRLRAYATVAVAAFLIGLVPMWLVAHSRANERDAEQQELRLARLENTLAGAVILARRGDYESARAATSSFYTTLRSEIDRDQPVFSASQRETMRALLADRDQVITLLARGDSVAAERLANTYVSYRETTGTLPRPVADAR